MINGQSNIVYGFQNGVVGDQNIILKGKYNLVAG